VLLARNPAAEQGAHHRAAGQWQRLGAVADGRRFVCRHLASRQQRGAVLDESTVLGRDCRCAAHAAHAGDRSDGQNSFEARGSHMSCFRVV